jgi:hypothetical protein
MAASPIPIVWFDGEIDTCKGVVGGVGGATTVNCAPAFAD